MAPILHLPQQPQLSPLSQASSQDSLEHSHFPIVTTSRALPGFGDLFKFSLTHPSAIGSQTKMCKQAIAHFQCGHSVAMIDGVTRCKWGRMGGRDCPDFQMLPDSARSTCLYEVCLSCVAAARKSRKDIKSSSKKGGRTAGKVDSPVRRRTSWFYR